MTIFMIVRLIQLIGILIPLAGIAALLRNKHQSGNTLRLMLTNIGCLIMNSGYLLILMANDPIEAGTALKIEYLGEAIFYMFFFLFIQSYLNKRLPRPLIYIWIAFECAAVGLYWVDPVRKHLIGEYIFTKEEELGIFIPHIAPHAVYMIRYSVICLLFCIGIIYTTIKMFETKLTQERHNLARISGAQFVVAVSLVIVLLANPPFNVVPIFASLSILSMILSIIKDEFFGVKDLGHEWVFEQMDNAYMIGDSLHGYVDSNIAAKKLFPELEKYKTGEHISDELYKYVNSESNVIRVGEKLFEKKVTEIKNKDKIVGYGLLLEDITLIHGYNEKLRMEVAEKTEHIQLVQDSIIKGMATVVESRDNSTGGHINRTSMVIRIFSGKLLEHAEELGVNEEFLNDLVKAAPMHDIGKIAVDDVVLRKPGKFTDEEYAKMKEHSAEGAKVLKTVLSEVDDDNFKRIAINVAQSHHERFDGKGYPNSISGEEIPLEARIMALADVFDALVSKRCYKEALTYDKAFSIIEEGLGTQFDPVLGKLFMECRPQLEKLYSEME
ncbi:MAG: HD domain-containing protein [Oscillospiraceae bacterium]|nr:HD domain-containing protein [Oscillospiraceae bacterium]